LNALDKMIDKTSVYAQLRRDLTAVFEGERDLIANMANCSALLFQSLPDLNWAGFYRTIGSDLVLGPFQGRPACVRIGLGRGVCGAAAANKKTVLVPDVHEFPGHIACDAASKSEVVIPLIDRGRVIAVLDLDSPILNRFDQADADGLETLVAVLLESSDL